MAAWAGVIGYALRKFNLTNSSVDVSGYFASYTGYYDNHAVVAVVPVKDGDKAGDPAPSVAESNISGNNIKCLLYTYALGNNLTNDAQNINDLSSNTYNQTIATADQIKANLVCGEGFTANSGITIGEDTTGDGIIDNNTYIAGTAN